MNSESRGAGAAEEGSASQKRHNADRQEDAMHTLTRVLSVMAHARLLPKPAWSLCRSVHYTERPIVHLRLSKRLPLAAAAEAFVRKIVVRLSLSGPFDEDPLLALAAASAPGAGTTENLDAFYGDVKAMTLDCVGVGLAHTPRSLQQVQLNRCDPDVVCALLRTPSHATDSGPQSGAPTLAAPAPLHDTLTHVPERACGLSALTSLSLEACNGTTSLPDGIGGLTALTALKLHSCRQLTDLPDSISGLTRLTALSLCHCSRLARLPNSIGALTALATLNLSYCVALVDVPETIGGLSALTALHLRSCQELKCLPDVFDSITALTTLNLSGCQGLRCLPSSIGDLVALTELMQVSAELASQHRGPDTLDVSQSGGLRCEEAAARFPLPRGADDLVSARHRFRALSDRVCQRADGASDTGPGLCRPHNAAGGRLHAGVTDSTQPARLGSTHVPARRRRRTHCADGA
eukprot:TRINITY_DN6738_c0_g2_i3.p1 TRINITY_DN6738_c0_g2~~TRINITY_DN6738_c0_g2_i3.p1  ORF type:complete len:464 (-),score=48.88 TRINITY_DN6738_c0_g2_i3:1351-2742(-)